MRLIDARAHAKWTPDVEDEIQQLSSLLEEQETQADKQE
jgi:hypothetical protein